MGFFGTAPMGDVLRSLENVWLKDEGDRDALYEKYADYYDGTIDCVGKYFKKRSRETEERFRDRPKISWPLCRTISDVHADALVGGLAVEILDKESNLRFQEHLQHNGWDSFKRLISTIVSVYGACGIKPVVHDDGTKEKQIEWIAHSPDEIRYIYERTSIKRSVKRFLGIAIESAYSVENDAVFAWPVTDPALKSKDIRRRVELITKDRWVVLLDGNPTPVSPHGDIWMPSENGVNPFNCIPSPLFNGKPTHESFLGQSDIHHTTDDVQTINELFSDIVYMHRMYVPIPIMKTANRDSRKAFSLGIGAGFAMAPGDSMEFANASIDWSGVLEPLRIALETMYSNAKAPAVAVGLGHLFGDAQRVSGKAKVFEWKPTISHAEAKRETFTMGVEALYKAWATIASARPPFGQGLNVKPDSPVRVTYNPEIVPVDKAEQLDSLTKEITGGMVSVYTAMMKHNGWDGKRAAKEMDLIRAQTYQYLTDLGWEDIVKIAEERRTEHVSLTELQKAEGVLFSAKTAPVEPVLTGGKDADGGDSAG